MSLNENFPSIYAGLISWCWGRNLCTCIWPLLILLSVLMFIILDLLALIKRISHIIFGVGTPLPGQLFINKIRYPKFYSTRAIIIFGENALCSSFKYFKIFLTAKIHSCILQARICFFTLRLCFRFCLELVGQYASKQRSTNHTSRNHSCIFNKSAATQPVLLIFIIVIICHSIPSSKTIL